jgi:formamidopyrimidine-DNA glycosylase
MPELPDVAGLKQYLDATALHKTIEQGKVGDDRILAGVSRRKLCGALKGSCLQSSRRHGKHLFVRLRGKKHWLRLHFGMTGNLNYYEGDGDPPDHTRLRLDFKGNRHLAYISQRMIGEVGLVDDPQTYIEENDLGPDALADDFSRERFVEVLSGRRGSIKSALMNQSVLAGIGNVYSDEILLQAGLHPDARVDKLSDKRLEELYGVMRRVLKVTADKQADVDRFPRGYLTRRRGKGEQCPRCGGKIKSAKISGRTSYFCPKCQKKS